MKVGGSTKNFEGMKGVYEKYCILRGASKEIKSVKPDGGLRKILSYEKGSTTFVSTR